ncbi:SAF domain-containing protein [Streptacidiphilus griseoplanus]|uniref:SAF domain-containing protein n=1 Tax=Peterkaempfera griseoplana TaxID=66896 RepID=UPI000B1E4E93|nr:SAF domain-containing protein [Peterkaempfera griseoplana]
MENRAFPSPLASPPQSVGDAARPSGQIGADRAALDRPGAVVPPRALRARRRRPAVLALSVALIAAGGLGGAALYTATGERVSVLAVARDVPAGQQLTAADLTIARIASDPALHPLDAGDLDRAIGRRATNDLKRGSLLTKDDVTNQLIVKPGQQIVGVAAKHTQLPATALKPGRQVLVVATPDTGGQQNGAGATTRPQTLSATVVTVGGVDTDGTVVVDMAVDASSGPRLAEIVAGGKFMVILAPERSGG